MNIVDAFDLDLSRHELICLVGAGGKTTTMFALAQELKTRGKSVLVTTTTNIFYPSAAECDEVIIDGANTSAIFQRVEPGRIIGLGSDIVKERKLAGVDRDFLDKLLREKRFDCILVECDGAKHKPIKAPAAYEPIVPDNATRAIGVIGLDAVGSPIEDACVHRLAEFCAVVRRAPGDIVDEEAVVELIMSAQGLFKGVPDGCKKYVLLNKAENSRRKASAGNILVGLLKRDCIPVTKCVIAAMAHNRIYP
jgi:probable selenium-dependent hydroxylase accessory protein YqeC